MWVLKSAYGCEGDETVCGPFVSDEEWRDTLAHIIPEFWICQRFFSVAPESNASHPNYGVYLVGGRSAGFYTRLSVAATDEWAITAPTYVERRDIA